MGSGKTVELVKIKMADHVYQWQDEGQLIFTHNIKNIRYIKTKPLTKLPLHIHKTHIPLLT